VFCLHTRIHTPQHTYMLLFSRNVAICLCVSSMVALSYVESAERLQAEAGLSLSRVDTADNMNLLVVLQVSKARTCTLQCDRDEATACPHCPRSVFSRHQEFEEYYEMKFGCKPKLVRKIAGTSEAGALSIPSCDSVKEHWSPPFPHPLHSHAMALLPSPSPFQMPEPITPLLLLSPPFRACARMTRPSEQALTPTSSRQRTSSPSPAIRLVACSLRRQ